MALMQITVVPVGTSGPSVGEYIADVERYLLSKEIEHTLHDMGTIIAGSTTDLLRLAGEIHRLPFTHGAERVITSITIDERLDMDRRLGEKSRSVTRRIEDSEIHENKI